jgi:hypothetical protein
LGRDDSPSLAGTGREPRRRYRMSASTFRLSIAASVLSAKTKHETSDPNDRCLTIRPPSSINILIRIAVGRPLRAEHGRSTGDRRNSEADVQVTGRIDCCGGIAAVRDERGPGYLPRYSAPANLLKLQHPKSRTKFLISAQDARLPTFALSDLDNYPLSPVCRRSMILLRFFCASRRVTP